MLVGTKIGAEHFGTGGICKDQSTLIVLGSLSVKYQWKEDRVTLPYSFPATDIAADATMQLWVEATDPSATLRDIELKLTYSVASGIEDVVNATGIWATQTRFRNTQAILLGNSFGV